MATKKAMNKSQIASYLSRKAGVTKKTAESVLDDLAVLAYNESKKKGEFTIPGIGKLILSKRKARKGRNPATGQEVRIPAKKVVKFRLAKRLRHAVGAGGPAGDPIPPDYDNDDEKK